MRAPAAVAVRKNRSVSYYTQISMDTSTSRLNATDRGGGQLLLGHDSVFHQQMNVQCQHPES
jgi:hypothetical protein